ncbi:MAG: OmpA family protein [Spirochaetia bacterium]|nr:OmpA family protein [Spirochaetia bacterium]
MKIFQAKSFFIPLSLMLLWSNPFAQDWPVYKGNLYLTGNNDEIVVKNNQLKWIQKSGNALYNPVVSDGKIYIVDRASVIYCLDEETGIVVWNVNLVEISREFTGTERKPGKIKYPVIKDRFLIISDATMIYAIDKNNGTIIWSRTALQNEEHPEQIKKAVIDGIYSDPTIHGNEIIYGTRSVLIARELANGHLKWNRSDIKSYAGFPVFYDACILATSMDYSTQKYFIYNLDIRTGENRWVQEIEKPFKIFSPVVYNQKVFLPVGMKIYALDLDSGKILWQKDYREYVTSNISFTDREIVFSLNNKDVVSANPETGEIQTRISYPEAVSPYFLMTRDQIYIAANSTREFAEESGKNKMTFAKVRTFIKENPPVSLWEFDAPFSGAVSQPVSSKGVLFLPAGNFLYAIGDNEQSKLTQTGNDYELEKTDEKGNIHKTKLFENILSDKQQQNPSVETPKIPERSFHLSIQDEKGNPVHSEVEVIARKNGKVVYDKKLLLEKDSEEINIPDVESVEINSGSGSYAPKKTIVHRGENEKIIVARKIAKGESFSMDNIGFQTNMAYLTEDSLELLNKTSDLLKNHPDLKMEIRGHTDSAGDKKYNQTLSEKRAEAVREYLIKQGISPLRLRTRGYGDTKPVADNATEEGKAKNRRTEFYIEK